MSGPASTRSVQALQASVVRLLRPLVRVLLRYGLPYGAFADIAKRVYIDIAASDFRIPGRKQTTSRVSILTGLSRKEVRRVQNLDMPSDKQATDRYNRAARVIGGWVSDGTYKNEHGGPVALEVEGPEPSFSGLVRRYSGDVPVRAILDELLRVEAVRRTDSGRIELCARAYVPRGAEIDKLEILGTDVADLTATIARNILVEPDQAFFQRKVAYDNLSEESLPELRALASAKGQTLLEDLNERMAPLDRDVNPEAGGSGRKRALVGVYYYEGDAEVAEEEAGEE